MESYAKAKKLLLTKASLDTAIINADDAMGAKLIQDPEITAKKYSFSITPINARDTDNSVWTEAVSFHDSGIEAEIVTPWGEIQFATSMIGQFNLSNCLAVITTLGAMGYSIKDVAKELATMPFVKGRMESFGGEDKPLVIVDYAHTPDALKHVLLALRPHTNHKLWCVVGCGGNRDKGKRSEMAAIAESLADHLVFTSDNPRGESIEDIINDMLTGLNEPSDCSVEYSRELAIKSSISNAVLGDVVLVAGKGHEKVQVIGTTKIPFSDEDVVTQALSRGSWK
jgi:UDP-N-acetylmuramoyl-L-alanyl-D-glutamate--2,6-diaminopimelate ligase